MVEKLLDMARRVGAEAVVVSCQMCQANLDMYQERIQADTGKHYGLPVVYFTELIGLAWGLAEARGGFRAVSSIRSRFCGVKGLTRRLTVSWLKRRRSRRGTRKTGAVASLAAE